jgi:aspartate aminotransferase-like enzyme
MVLRKDRVGKEGSLELDRANSKDLSLFTPGPVDLSDHAKSGLTRPVEHHRTESFRHLLGELLDGLKTAFRTSDDIAALTSSGTGAMEAVVASLFSPGDRVLVPVGGKFGRRWVEICAAFGVDVTEIRPREVGDTASPEEIRNSLLKEPSIAAVLLTHSETSTGSLADLKSIGRVIRETAAEQGRRILCCADCISSLCVDELNKDDWGIDCAVTASQKGLLAPPGLAFVCLDSEAVSRMKTKGGSGYYFDLRRYWDDVSRSPFTPAVPLLRAVRESLGYLLGLGLDNVVEAHRSAAEGLRRIVEHAGFRLVASQPSNAVTAFWIDDVDPLAAARLLRDEHGIVVAQGQEELYGRILRVSPIGKSRESILAFGRAFEATMGRLGREFILGDIMDELNRTLEGSGLWESQL